VKQISIFILNAFYKFNRQKIHVHFTLAGMDLVWKQEKPNARRMLENAAYTQRPVNA
jgi:hypothetical protein